MRGFSLKFSFLNLNLSVIPIGQYVYIPVGGVIAFLGILAASWVLIRTVRDEKVSLKFLTDHLFFFVFIPLFAGRFGAFLSDLELVMNRLPNNFFGKLWELFSSFFLIGQGGLRADWAVGGFFVTFLILAMWKKQKHCAWLDAFILPGIVVSFFVAIGGYFSGWGYGAPAPEWLPFPLSVSYDLQAVRYSGPIYAVQLYSAVLLFIAFWVGWYFWQHKIWKQWPAGKFFAVMIFLLGLENGFLELFRGDVVINLLNIRLPMILSFGISLLALLFLYLQKKESFLKKLSHC